MKRIVGILIIVLVLYGYLMVRAPRARTMQNHQRIAERLALYGVMTLGAGVLIISGGIDLSIGSVVALSGISLGLLLNQQVSQPLAVLVVLLMAVLIGLFHGVLVTWLRLQPFIVTLCGLFIYRGLAYFVALPDPLAAVRALVRYLSFDLLYGNSPSQIGSAGNIGIGERSKDLGDLIFLSTGYSDVFPFSVLPMRFWLMLGIAGLVALLLHWSIYGRYLFAIGANEQAARYAGIATNRYKIMAYVLCAVLAAVAGMLEMLELQTMSPSNTGNWYELYAITGAVLGGCSLRGGEGTVIGMLLGTAVLPLLRNLINFSSIPEDLTFTVIGVALLLGTIADEMLKRRAKK
jgi:ribose transport system permease protein